MAAEPISIVLAEDDDGHATLVQRNLQRTGVVNGFVRVKDGQEALDFIRGEGAYAEQPSRGGILLLLDINMPRVDGIEASADPLLELRAAIYLLSGRRRRAAQLEASKAPVETAVAD